VGWLYERLGVPQWADFYYESGLRFMSESSCCAARWQLKFLCGRARLALSGFPCRSLSAHCTDGPAGGALNGAGDASSGAKEGQVPVCCLDASTPLVEVEELWNNRLSGSPSVALLEEESAAPLAPHGPEEGLGPPVELLELWAAALLQRMEKECLGVVPPPKGLCLLASRLLGLATAGAEQGISPLASPSSGRGLGHLVQALGRCDGVHELWRACLSHVSAAIPTDAAMPLPSGTSGWLLGIAAALAQAFWQPWVNQLAPSMAQQLRAVLRQCEATLHGSQGFLQAEQRSSLHDMLARVIAGSCESATSGTMALERFQAALLLSIAALQCGLQSGHSLLVRQAAMQVTLLSSNAAEWLARGVGDEKSALRLPRVPIFMVNTEAVRCSARSRSPRKAQELHDDPDVSGRICTASVPLCSGATVLFLHELRSMQRAFEGLSEPQLSSHLLSAPHRAEESISVSKLCDGTWLSGIPEGVAVAWVHLDQHAEAFQISRMMDGPSDIRVAGRLFSRRISLRAGVFSHLEEEFRAIQEENQSTIRAHLLRPDCNSGQGKKVYWDCRKKFDAAIQRLAQRLQEEVMQEWRFLLVTWPREQEACSLLLGSFRDFAAAESGSELLTPSPGRTCLWVLALLYASADQMSSEEVAAVLAALLPTPRSGRGRSRQVAELAKSMQRHRSAARREAEEVRPTPLLLFVDSAAAQLPLEACPILWRQEIVRAVSPNATLGAFQRFSGRRAVVAAPPESGYFLVDPFGDTSSSSRGVQELMRRWSAPSRAGASAGPLGAAWHGRVGGPAPEVGEVLGMLGSRDVFLYMGHGEGARRLLRHELVQRGALAPSDAPSSTRAPRFHPLRAVMLLLGCSSAKTFQALVPGEASGPLAVGRRSRRADFEAFGMPLNVLIGGGPAMLGALWDVLGGDLDKLACSFLERWARPGRGKAAAANTGAGPGCEAPLGLMGALVAARKDCMLPFLTGASMVCYGIPL